MPKPVLAGLSLAVALAVTVFVSLPGRTVSAAVPCSPGVELIGFSEALNKTTFGGFPVTEISGFARDGQTNTYFAIADQGAVDPSHFFTIEIPVTADALGTPVVRAVTRLQAVGDGDLTGAAFDGEAIALTSNRELIVASEGGNDSPLPGPNLISFSLAGRFLQEYPVAPIYFVAPSGNAAAGMTFNSLTLSPSGRNMFTINEASLTIDGQTPDLRVRARLQRYQDFERAGQFYYLTEPGRSATDVGVVELIALSDTDLLVLERGFVVGQGNTVRLVRTSIAGAQDISGYGSLADAGLTPLPKTLLVDLAACPGAGATIAPGATQPNALLDNFEAIALGPELDGNRRVILLLSDDNSGANQTTRVIALAVSNALLGLQPSVTVRPPATGDGGLLP